MRLRPSAVRPRPLSPPGPGCRYSRRGAGPQTHPCTALRSDRHSRSSEPERNPAPVALLKDSYSCHYLTESEITEPPALRQDVGTFREWPPRRDSFRLWRYVDCDIEWLYCSLFCWHVVKPKLGRQPLQVVLKKNERNEYRNVDSAPGLNTIVWNDDTFVVKLFP